MNETFQRPEMTLGNFGNELWFYKVRAMIIQIFCSGLKNREPSVIKYKEVVLHIYWLSKGFTKRTIINQI